MDNLLNSLLYVAQLDHAELNRVPVDMNATLDDVAELLTGRFADAGVDLRRRESLPWAYCDPILVREVLTNLLTNATKYAGENPRWVEVGYGTAVPASGAVVSECGDAVPAFYVKDNGIGVAEQFHDEIFKVFRRLHRGEDRGGGIGVGLAISRRIIERHGGRLWITSARDRGSTLWFTLPRCPAENGADPSIEVADIPMS